MYADASGADASLAGGGGAEVEQAAGPGADEAVAAGRGVSYTAKYRAYTVIHTSRRIRPAPQSHRRAYLD